MPTIKYNTDEQDNKKIIIKVDPETDETKVSCGCCACGGCGTIGENLDGATTISISASFTAFINGESYERSAQGQAPTDSCFAVVGDSSPASLAGYEANYYASVSIFKDSNTGECFATIGAGFQETEYGEYCYGTTVVPINQILGTFTVSTGYGGAEGSSACSSGFFSLEATITIS